VSEYEYMKIGINKATLLCLFLAGCQNVKQESPARVQEYPLEIAIHGPFKPDQFRELKGTIWLNYTALLGEEEMKLREDFYIAEISNLLSDTVLISVSDGIGNLWFRYLCFDFDHLEGDCLYPTEGKVDVYDIEKWDTLIPNTTRKYLHFRQIVHETGECDLVHLSVKTRSVFFDSLNALGSFRYTLDGMLMNIELQHPVYLFAIREGHFIPAAHRNIQKDIDKCLKKMKRRFKEVGNSG
jgi:hypothetical protein